MATQARFRRRTSHEPNRVLMRENKGFFSFAFNSAHVKYGVWTWPQLQVLWPFSRFTYLLSPYFYFLRLCWKLASSCPDFFVWSGVFTSTNLSNQILMYILFLYSELPWPQKKICKANGVFFTVSPTGLVLLRVSFCQFSWKSSLATPKLD